MEEWLEPRAFGFPYCLEHNLTIVWLVGEVRELHSSQTSDKAGCMRKTRHLILMVLDVKKTLSSRSSGAQTVQFWKIIEHGNPRSNAKVYDAIVGWDSGCTSDQWVNLERARLKKIGTFQHKIRTQKQKRISILKNVMYAVNGLVSGWHSQEVEFWFSCENKFSQVASL